jgi:hypothetical protein
MSGNITDDDLCDLITHTMRTGQEPLSKAMLVVCGQISMAFVKAIECRRPIRARVVIGYRTSDVLTKIHPRWFRFAVDLPNTATGRRWGKKIQDSFSEHDDESVCIVHLTPVLGKSVELWCGFLDRVGTTCQTCSKEYKTMINARRCCSGPVDPAKADRLRHTWDALSPRERATIFDRLRHFAQFVADTSDIEDPVGKFLISMVRHGTIWSGKRVVDTLDHITQGTLGYTLSEVPKPDLFTLDDNLAILACNMERALLAKAIGDDLEKETALEALQDVVTRSIDELVKNLSRNVKIDSSCRMPVPRDSGDCVLGEPREETWSTKPNAHTM